MVTEHFHMQLHTMTLPMHSDEAAVFVHRADCVDQQARVPPQQSLSSTILKKLPGFPVRVLMLVGCQLQTANTQGHTPSLTLHTLHSVSEVEV